MPYLGIRRKVFVSYYGADQVEVDAFVERWATVERVFIPKILGPGPDYDRVDSSNSEYVMSVIRRDHLGDSSVTIVLIGACTHSRRYVDWEIKASLRQGEYAPNGLAGIILPSQGTSAHLPPRFRENWKAENADYYARYWPPPSSAAQLAMWIEDAYAARESRAHLIRNSQDLMGYNAKCSVHGVTH
jgi:hypothetical protein